MNSSLSIFLDGSDVDRIIGVIANASIKASKAINDAVVNGTIYDEKKNVYGDDVNTLDSHVNSVFLTMLDDSKLCTKILSEENERPVISNRLANYHVLLDPLDGSSNVDLNLSTGTIFAIRDSHDNVVAAGYVLYGASTLLILAKGGIVRGFALKKTGSFFKSEEYTLTHSSIKCPAYAKFYSINEAYQHIWLTKDDLTNSYVQNAKKAGHNTRNYGCMVADLHRILFKGGIFMYPENSRTPQGKLRLLYEAIPFAFIFETAMGTAKDTNNESIISKHPETIHDRSSIIIGSQRNVKAYFDS